MCKVSDTCSDEGNRKEGDLLADLRIDMRLIIKWVLRNRTGEGELDSTVSGQEQLLGFCVHRNEL